MKFHNYCVSKLLLALLFCSYSAAFKQGDTCMVNKVCDDGLHCETCIANGDIRPRCTRIQPLNPLSKVKGLPFNRYSWLTTHNSFAKVGAKSGTKSLLVTESEMAGLDVDMYDFQKCMLVVSFFAVLQQHSFFATFLVFLGSRSLIILVHFLLIKATAAFCLNEVLMVFDGRGSVPVSRMPKNGGKWPTVDDMVQQNQRLVVFTSKSAKESSEGIAYEWSPIVKKMMLICIAAGKRPEFIAVDFYKKEGLLMPKRCLNPKSTNCGCSNVGLCKENMTHGVCGEPEAAPANGVENDSSFADSLSISIPVHLLFQSLIAAILLSLYK
ncbi:hypothetical protein Leryth_017667 [Lithospermum erythrorhizon]|nr:hypothetical protein Leryth_017667 [Lithospermum erythrorhizon]